MLEKYESILSFEFMSESGFLVESSHSREHYTSNFTIFELNTEVLRARGLGEANFVAHRMS